MGLIKNAANFITFGAIDRKSAKKITKNASQKKDDVKEELGAAKESTRDDIENLGILKEKVYAETISSFLISKNNRNLKLT